MYKIKKMPINISLFLISIIAMIVYYFFFDYYTIGLFIHYGYAISALTLAPYILITLFLYAMVFCGLMAVIYGFLHRRPWTQKFAILYIVWALLWPVWSLLVGNNVFLNFVYLVIYVLMIIYLFSQRVIDYFEKIKIFTYNGYTLYKKDVQLKNKNGIVTIHFFSKKEPKSGTPTYLPEGYTVEVNKRSKMPYLKKINNKKEEKKIYTYKDYTLYKRDVKLKNKNGMVTIHFFSKHKPKSGTPTYLPEGYTVGVNKRSKMPYLKKKSNKKEEKKKTEKEEDKKTNNNHKRNSNVIYVVSKPQPGQVKGDWAVRTHGKIFSHHRIKVNAIKAARKLGREKKATVLIQKTDGTFSKSYKQKK